MHGRAGARFPSLRDLQVAQSLDYPTVEVQVDREKAGTVYVTPADVSPLAGRGHLVEPLRRAEYWPDPKTGIGYQVQVEIPRPVVRSPRGIKPIGSIADLETVPVKRNAAGPGAAARRGHGQAPAPCPANTTATT